MNPLLEVNPDACIVVVGPLLSRTCLHVVPDSLKLTYSSLILSGLEMVHSEEREQLGQLCRDNIDDAAEKICTLLRSLGHIETWIASNAGTPCNCIHRQSPLLRLLLEMQSQGCRLVYTHYDNILDVAAGMIPILPINDDHLEKWLNGQLKGFLHLHGHYSDVDSLILYSSIYDSILSSLNHFSKLQDFFKRRTVIFIGHDPNHLNPLLVRMTNTLLCNESDTIRNPPLFVSSMTPPIPSCFLHLPITILEEENFHLFMIPGPETSFVIGRTSDKQVDKEIIRSQAVLIFSEKQSFRKLGDIIYQLNQSGEIYVRRDALTILFGSKIMYGNILTYGGCGLRRIWELSVPAGSVLRGKGLIAVGLQNSLMIWINKKPINLGPITEVNTFHSLWNNSAAAMKSQPHAATTPAAAPTTCTSSPITSLSPSYPFNTTTTTSWPTPPTLLTLTQPAAAAGVTGLPYSALTSYRPLFPVLPSPFIPIDRTLLAGGTPSLRPTTVLANLPYQIYSSGPSGLKGDTPDSEPPPLLEQRPDFTVAVVSESVSVASSVVDVDNSGDGSVQLSEEESSTAAVCLVAEPPILLQELVLEELKRFEHKITTEVNSTTSTSIQTLTDSRPAPSSVLRPSALSLRPPPPLIAMSTSSSSSDSNSGNITGIPSTPLLVAAAPPQVQPCPPPGGSSIQRPVAMATPLLQPFSLVGGGASRLPSNTPLHYPFAISPYSFFPSLLPQQQTNQSEYILKVISTMSSSMPPSAVVITSPPAMIPSVTSTPTLLVPQMSSTVGPASILLPQQLKILSEGTSNQLITNTSGSETENEMSEMSGTSHQTVSGALVDHNNSEQDIHDADVEGDSRTHLWEFILHLLLTPNHGNLIQWTGDNYEFTIIDPEGLTAAWSNVSNTDNRNFNTILGTLRSYSGLGILEPVQDKKLTYTFVMDIQRYMTLYGQNLINFTNDND